MAKKGQYHKARPLFEVSFPDVFTSRGQPPVPLAIGSGARIAEAFIGKMTEAEISEFLMVWCRRPEYQIALINHTNRFDLEGKPEGSVSASEKEFAEDGLCKFLLRKIKSLANGRLPKKLAAKDLMIEYSVPDHVQARVLEHLYG